MGKRRIIRAKGPREGVRTTRIVVPRELQTPRLRMFYFESGVGAPLILIHGLGGSARWWFPMFPELTSANFRALAVDLPGFGRSRSSAFLSMPDAAKAVIELADHMGLGQFFLCGHSMGGAVAIQAAAHFGRRVRRMVLIDSAGIPRVGPGRAMLRLAQPWSWCPAGFYSTFIGDVLRAGPRTMLEGIRELRRYDVRPILDRVRAPTLVVWGEKDRLLPPAHGERIAEGLPDGRLEIIEGARHLPMISHPDNVARLITRFLKEDVSKRPGGSG